MFPRPEYLENSVEDRLMLLSLSGKSMPEELYSD